MFSNRSIIKAAVFVGGIASVTTYDKAEGLRMTYKQASTASLAEGAPLINLKKLKEQICSTRFTYMNKEETHISKEKVEGHIFKNIFESKQTSKTIHYWCSCTEYGFICKYGQSDRPSEEWVTKTFNTEDKVDQQILEQMVKELVDPFLQQVANCLNGNMSDWDSKHTVKTIIRAVNNKSHMRQLAIQMSESFDAYGPRHEPLPEGLVKSNDECLDTYNKFLSTYSANN